jgi:hypothetical protein
MRCAGADPASWEPCEPVGDQSLLLRRIADAVLLDDAGGRGGFALGAYGRNLFDLLGEAADPPAGE